MLMTKKEEEQIQKMMKNLELSYEEAVELLAEDKRIDKMKDSEVNADLTEEQQKTIKKARQAERKPTVYNFNKRERKANPTKGSIIAELAQFLTENSENACENVEITNKERQIAFKIGENLYELTLVQKRKPKK